MNDLAIRVDSLGKRYVIGGKQEKYATLRDTIVDMAATPFRRVRGVLRGESAAGLKEEIWALKDVSFEVKHGEVVGIIGRNGAGKSTLLKILSRITDPTTGYADVYGRIGALLEVGTGFHPELTGRENVFLNGAILGMSREEINRKFDEIVDFAGIEKFIDTPVKHYSSGMGLRLGFAVAAHLEPEILIVDEVLAVGDAEFQKKCLGKMGEVAGEGRTVLFVSHNMAAVASLCTKSILLVSGRVLDYSKTADIISKYERNIASISDTPLSERLDRRGTGLLRVTKVSALSLAGGERNYIPAGKPVDIELRYSSQAGSPLREVLVSIEVIDPRGVKVFTCSNEHEGTVLTLPACGGRLVCSIPNLPLVPGSYRINVWIAVDGQAADQIQHASQFHVVASDFFPSGNLPDLGRHGPILVFHSWSALAL
jgi:lipopolysaccharide transport system ATP-binding protein